MKDKPAFEAFAEMTGFKRYEAKKDGLDYIYLIDSTTGENVETCGYDDIQILGIFRETTLVQLFLVSYVGDWPDEFYEALKVVQCFNPGRLR